jgi:hypothetical protein
MTGDNELHQTSELTHEESAQTTFNFVMSLFGWLVLVSK